jgi:apolipoprotein N-acyltransferase
MVQMRAKENGRWFIRATNTGVTAFIDQNGHIVKQAPIDKEAVLRGELPAMQGETLYTRLSDWPILGFSLLLLIMGWFYRPKKSMSALNHDVNVRLTASKNRDFC